MTTIRRAPNDRIFHGCSFSVEEIWLARTALPLQRMTIEIGGLMAAFEARDVVAVKLASDRLRDVAHEAARGAARIEALAGVLGRTFGSHLARRARVL